MRDFATNLPKAELHIHIEGSLEPEMAFEQAHRNGVELPFSNVASLKAAYDFTDLQSFLDIYYQTAAVLRTERDFYELMSAYLTRAAADGVRRAEVFFDPQTHTERGVGFEVFMKGFQDAIRDVELSADISADLIMCFLRHLPGEDAEQTLRDAEPHLDRVIGVGLDSSEVGNPPELFEEVYDRARQLGLHTVAHAGEEGPPSYVTGALDVLGAERIEHGIRSMEDPDLVDRLRRERIPLTVCPLSNVALAVVDRLADHPLPQMLEAGMNVSINSDDPSYFGGYVVDNYVGVAEEFEFNRGQLAGLARNSINSAFIPEEEKQALIASISED